MKKISDYLSQAVASGAANVYIAAGAPVSAGREGGIEPLDDERLHPSNTEKLIEELYALADRDMEAYRVQLQDSFSFSQPGLARFWVSAYWQRRSLAAALKILPFTIPDWQKLGIPQAVMDLTGLGRGLVLLSGPKGSGRATTMACMVDSVKRSRACHIVTVEDPIQYLHKNDRSMISQLELGTDTVSYAAAMRSCLSQTAEVVFLGGIPDLETLGLCITAAETGRLVVAALPVRGTARSAAHLIRLTDALPEAEREQALFQLSRLLGGAASQQLLPLRDGGAGTAFEIMPVDGTVRELIRAGDAHRLAGTPVTGKDAVSMDQAISRLYQEGKLSLETALSYADNPDQLRRRLG